MIRVLIAEDSAVTRDYLVYLLGQDPAIVVVGTARDGREAVDQAELLRPDAILMDVRMPELNGYEATREIMARFPIPIVMISASFDADDAVKSFAALEAGALTVLGKPAGLAEACHAAMADELVRTVKLMAEIKVVRRWPKRNRTAAARAVSPNTAPERCVRIVAIGASTGGPPVIAEILRSLPGDLPAPILLAQHITPGFVSSLAEWLNRETPFRVKLGAAGERVRAGAAYLAPDGVQMGITPEQRIFLSCDAADNGFCPSISHLFRSIAETYGRHALGVLLTGMGADGAGGLQQIRCAGGVTIVQDEGSSVVFGMPAEAIRLGAAQYTLAPSEIAQTIRNLVARD